jgi:hypothetical protein
MSDTSSMKIYDETCVFSENALMVLKCFSCSFNILFHMEALFLPYQVRFQLPFLFLKTHTFHRISVTKISNLLRQSLSHIG